MDIAIVGKNSIKIKGKRVTFVVDPSAGSPKTSADAVILLNGLKDVDLNRVTDSRTVINGAGGYEVAGAKISATSSPEGIIYKLSIDGVSIVLGKTTKSKVEGISGSQVAVINADSEFNESFVADLESKIIVIYGEAKKDAAKKLGAESITETPKITLAKELPEKMEIAVLG